MRVNFNPTREAARRLSVSAAPFKATAPSAPVTEAKCCEWPRRAPAAVPRAGIRRALQEIQARHA
ncbi:MAG TPA: hypothetical protein VIM71_11230 [Lacunisphaera sp.]